MDRRTKGLTIGAGIILIGALALLANLTIISFGAELFWIVICAGLGTYFWILYKRDTAKWGLLIPAGILWVIALTIGLTIIPGVSANVAWSVFLLGFGCAFISIYVRDKKQWWGIIPGGVFVTFACMTFFAETRWLDANYTMFLFYFGLGLTFGFLYLVRDEENLLGWAQYPAACLLLLSFLYLLLTDDSVVARVLFPLSLIALGCVIVLRSIRIKAPAEAADRDVVHKKK